MARTDYSGPTECVVVAQVAAGPLVSLVPCRGGHHDVRRPRRDGARRPEAGHAALALHRHDLLRFVPALPGPAHGGPAGPAGARRCGLGLEQRDVGLPGAPARRLRLGALAPALPGPAPGTPPPRPAGPGVLLAAGRARLAGAADGQQRGPLRPAAPAGLRRPGDPGRLGPGPVDAELVRLRPGRQPLSAVRRLEPRQLRRPAGLPARGGTGHAARRAALDLEHWVRGPDPSRLVLRSGRRPLRGDGPERRDRGQRRRSSRAAQPAADGVVAVPVRGPVRADALDHHAPEHRHHGDAAAVGDPAGPLPAQLHDRVRRPPGRGPGRQPGGAGSAHGAGRISVAEYGADWIWHGRPVRADLLRRGGGPALAASTTHVRPLAC